MNLTEHEQKLLLRALDKASVDVEAEKAAETLIASLRKRGINGYEFLGEVGAKAASANPPPHPAPAQRPAPNSQTKPKPKRTEADQQAAWSKWADSIQASFAPEPEPEPVPTRDFNPNNLDRLGMALIIFGMPMALVATIFILSLVRVIPWTH